MSQESAERIPLRRRLSPEGFWAFGVDVVHDDIVIPVKEWTVWLAPLGLRFVWPAFWRCRLTWAWGYWR